MTPAQLDQLRRRLPPFGGAEPEPAGLQAYLDFYGLDFGQSHPLLEHKMGWLPSGDYRLMTHCWRQPDASHNLLLVHGLFDHTGIYDKLIAWALGAGCNVLMFDLPGHGLSTGARAQIGEFAEYGRAIDDVLHAVNLPELPLCAVGQSTGCAALVELARHHHWPFASCALLAPLVRPAGWAGIRVGLAVLSPFTESVARRFTPSSNDLQFLDFLRRDPLQCHRVSLAWLAALRRWLKGLDLEDLGVGPVLVVQGEKDSTVSWRYNLKAIAKLFPGSDIFKLPKAGHQLANESEPLLEAYQAELSRYLFS